MTNHQRIGSLSNAHVGHSFEGIAKSYLEKKLNLRLVTPFCVDLGINDSKRVYHKYDLGSEENKILIECKSHSWTKNLLIPSAKLINWDREMFFFFLLSQSHKYQGYRKIFFVQRFVRPYQNKKQSLAEYYYSKHGHLIPSDVEIWEFDVDLEKVKVIK